jgi:solute:Na+ symporter, SSS family
LVVVKNNTALSFLLYGFVGLIASVLLALVFSLVFPNQKEITGYSWKSRKRISQGIEQVD